MFEFEQIFRRAETVQRYLAASLSRSRLLYLDHRCKLGASHGTLKQIACVQLSAVQCVPLGEEGEVRPAAVAAAAERWADREPGRRPPDVHDACRRLAALRGLLETATLRVPPPCGLRRGIRGGHARARLGDRDDPLLPRASGTARARAWRRSLGRGHAGGRRPCPGGAECSGRQAALPSHDPRSRPSTACVLRLCRVPRPLCCGTGSRDRRLPGLSRRDAADRAVPPASAAPARRGRVECLQFRGLLGVLRRDRPLSGTTMMAGRGRERATIATANKLLRVVQAILRRPQRPGLPRWTEPWRSVRPQPRSRNTTRVPAVPVRGLRTPALSCRHPRPVEGMGRAWAAAAAAPAKPAAWWQVPLCGCRHRSPPPPEPPRSVPPRPRGSESGRWTPAGQCCDPTGAHPSPEARLGGPAAEEPPPSWPHRGPDPGPGCVQESAAGGRPASQRMFRCQQGRPVAALLGRVDPAHAHLAQCLERALDLHGRDGLPDHLRRAAGTASGAAAGSRERKTEIPGQLRQPLAGQGCAQVAPWIASLVPPTQLASQLRPAERAVLEFAVQPLDCGRLQNAETDAHCRRAT